jgi:hypothetical protein
MLLNTDVDQVFFQFDAYGFYLFINQQVSVKIIHHLEQSHGIEQFSLPAGDTKQQHSGPFSSPGRTLGMPSYAMGLQDQGLQCGPLHDQLAANRSMLH